MLILSFLLKICSNFPIFLKAILVTVEFFFFLPENKFRETSLHKIGKRDAPLVELLTKAWSLSPVPNPNSKDKVWG